MSLAPTPVRVPIPQCNLEASVEGWGAEATVRVTYDDELLEVSPTQPTAQQIGSFGWIYLELQRSFRPLVVVVHRGENEVSRVGISLDLPFRVIELNVPEQVGEFCCLAAPAELHHMKSAEHA